MCSKMTSKLQFLAPFLILTCSAAVWFGVTTWGDRQLVPLGTGWGSRFIIQAEPSSTVVALAFGTLLLLVLLVLYTHRKRAAVTILSVILGQATVFIWIRSFAATEHIELAFATHDTQRIFTDGYQVAWRSGAFVFEHYSESESCDDPNLLTSRPAVRLLWVKNIHKGFLITYPMSREDVTKTPNWLRYLGVDLSYRTPINSSVYTLHKSSLVVPIWLVLLALLAAPAMWLIKKLKALAANRRSIDMYCEHCNYDLRATPDASGALLDKCPECGTPTATRKPTASTATPPIPPAN